MAERQTPPPRRSDNSGERRPPVRSSSGERRPAPSRDYDRDRRPSTSSRSGSDERRTSQQSSRSGDRRQSSPRRNDVIRCENCGEDYSITYKRCPFCDERPGRGGISGKRVANTRGGGYGRPVNPIQIAGLVISLILIISALFIVFRFIGAPLFGGKHGGGSSVSSSQGSGSVNPNPNGSGTPAQTVQSIALNNIELTLDKGGTFRMVANLLPAGATGEVTWSSSDTSIATVDADGQVTNVNTGSTDAKVTITAVCGDVSAEADVICKAGGSVSNGTQGKVVNAKDGLRVRSGPGTTYDRIASLTNGSRVTIVGEENGWYKVIYKGDKTGYVSKDYISVG